MCLCRGFQCCLVDFWFSGLERKCCLMLGNSSCTTSHSSSCWHCSCPCLTAGNYYSICCTSSCSYFSKPLGTQRSKPCCYVRIFDYCYSSTPHQRRVRSCCCYSCRDCQPCQTWSGNCCGTWAAWMNCLKHPSRHYMYLAQLWWHFWGFIFVVLFGRLLNDELVFFEFRV